MDNVWESQVFASLAELIDEVNARGLTGDRFKVVPEPSPASRGLFHLLYLTGAEPDPLLATVGAAAALPATDDLDIAEERIEAVDEAEQIIRDGQHHEG